MPSTRKTWWAALALAAFAGCGDKTDSNSMDVPATSPATSETAGTLPSTGGNPGDMRPVMRDAAAPKVANPALSETNKTDAPPAVTPETPKVEGPKVEGPKAEEPKADAPKGDAPKGDAPKAAAVKLSDDEIAAIKKLPAGEQDAALKQAVCPVSSENLGGMGTPIKVTAEGKTFYLCCKGCEQEVKDHPKDVVAKLNK